MQAPTHDLGPRGSTYLPTEPLPIKIFHPSSRYYTKETPEWTYDTIVHFIRHPKITYFQPGLNATPTKWTTSSSHEIKYATNSEMKEDPSGPICTISPMKPYTPVDRKITLQGINGTNATLQKGFEKIPPEAWTFLGKQRPERIVVLGTGTADEHDLQWRMNQVVVRLFTTMLLDNVYGGQTDGFKGIVWNDTRWDGDSQPVTKDQWQWESNTFGKFASTVGGVTLKDTEIWDEIDEKVVVLVLGRYNPWRQLLGACISRFNWVKAPVGVLCVPFEEDGTTPGGSDKKVEKLVDEMKARYFQCSFWKGPLTWGGNLMVENLTLYVKKGQSE